MIERPRTPPAVRNLTDNFEHHPSLGAPLPEKRHSRARQPGALLEANSGAELDSIDIPLVDAIECAFITSGSMEPRTLADALTRPDAERWVAAALAEIEAHLENDTWELAQLPPGRRAIGSRWVFKIKRRPDGSIDKYKGRIVAQGFCSGLWDSLQRGVCLYSSNGSYAHGYCDRRCRRSGAGLGRRLDSLPQRRY